MQRRNPTPQTPLILAVSFANSAVFMGMAAWFVASPEWKRIELHGPDLAMIALAFAAGVAGMGVAFSSIRMRGWAMRGGRIEPDGSRGAGGVDTAATYLARSIPRFVLGGALVDACAVVGLVMAIALKQPEAGIVLCGLGAIGGMKLLFPAVQIMRRASALKSLEAAALAAAARA